MVSRCCLSWLGFGFFHESNWKKQSTGIRQGCTLSPYISLFIMTTFSADARADPEIKKIIQEPKNSLTKQYQELFKLDGAKLIFKDVTFSRDFGMSTAMCPPCSELILLLL